MDPISSLLFFISIFLLLLKLFFFKPKTPNFPPSPPKLPLIGNLHQLGSLPHQSLATLSQEYGPLMLLKLGQAPVLIISSVKIAEQVMKTHDLVFSNRPQTTAAKTLLYGCQDVGFAPYGEYWRQARKICVLELFSVKRVESFQYVRDEEIDSLINKIRKIGSDQSLDLGHLFFQTSNNIVSRCVLGEKFEDEDGKSRFEEISRKAMVIVTAFCVEDFFPSFGWIIDVIRGFHWDLKNCFKTLDEFFSKVVEEHKEKIKRSGGVINIDDYESKKDFVDIMLQLQQDDKLDYHFSLDNLKAIVLDMFVGGSDSTATGLEWTMTELMRKPRIMKKVQEEVRTIIGKKSKIEAEDIQKMEYMQCVIKESLRLHPPVPLLLPRETMADVEIEGYYIPSKTRVFVNAWAIQRDPQFWVNPNEFIPERFMDKTNSADYKGQNLEFIPFGSGRRKCPGLSFAIASFEFVLANILYWFDWKLPDGCESLDVEESNGLTVRKKKSLHLNPIPYVVSN
ncbi:cytochrome P450 71A1 [Cucumis sativus]|uniref:cytochrome P450 71A1 n=1 Tax=Cucumis sativus TaxID=3659 RepID=UPI0012F49FD6|nr:cytochrome P450 71A1 [Cucumis sativus]